jgi:uncharacterized protein (TIGR03435 family)
MRILHIAVLSAATSLVATAQQSTQLPAPAVENVTAVPSISAHGNGLNISGDTLTATGVTIPGIMQRLYGVPSTAILGLTPEQAARRYDITAKIDAPADYSAVPGHLSTREYMLTVLLTKYLGIAAHTELRSTPVYALVVASGGARVQPLAVAAKPVNTGIDSTGHSIDGHAITLTSFANTLGMLLGRTVVDQTGLSGSYNLSLNWQPDHKASADSVTAALLSQLGLTLAPTEAPVKTVVVDHAELASN